MSLTTSIFLSCFQALSELSQLCENCDKTERTSFSSNDEKGTDDSKPAVDPNELSKTVLPQWSKCFPKLTVDDSRKVRELTQSTHTVICKAVGRNLAPYLKQLMPYWYLAQFDIYSPVSSAAKKSYQTVFANEKKQGEVLKFCVAEIIAHLSNNLDTAFRVRKTNDQQKDKKKQNKKTKGAQGQDEQVTSENTPVVEDSFASSSNSKGTDSESYEIRASYSSLQCIGCLIQLQLANEEFLEFVFGTDGVFWDGAEFNKDILVCSC